MLVRRVIKTGGSWTVSIPPHIWRTLDINPGDNVTICFNDRTIVMEKLDIPSRKLEKLLKEEKKDERPVQ